MQVKSYSRRTKLIYHNYSTRVLKKFINTNKTLLIKHYTRSNIIRN